MIQRAKKRDPNQLVVGGIPQEATEDVIKKYFANFGAVEYVIVKSTVAVRGVSHKFCFLTFSSEEEAELCLSKKDEHHIMETRVDVKRPRYRPEKEDHTNHHERSRPPGQRKFRISGNGHVRTNTRQNGQNSRGGLKVKQRNDKGKGHYASRSTRPPSCMRGYARDAAQECRRSLEVHGTKCPRLLTRQL